MTRGQARDTARAEELSVEQFSALARADAG